MQKRVPRIAVVAIVEDDDPLRGALESVLRSAGFQVDPFSSAEAFLSSGDRERTDCLLLDVRLPGMSGLELQRRLTEMKDPIPIVFVTAHGDQSLRDLALRAGAAGFLLKPVRRETLVEAIQAAIERGGATRHRER
jgi:two-component system, LuxR family, response regulator FixJ